MDSQSPEEWVDRFGDEPRKGADIVVQCLEREGAHRVFAYPGGCSMEIHQALTRSNLVKNTLCRHEQVSTSSSFRACTKLCRQGGCCLPVAMHPTQILSHHVSQPNYCVAEAHRHTDAKVARLAEVEVSLHLTRLMCPAHVIFADLFVSTSEHEALLAFTACTCHKTPMAAAG